MILDGACGAFSKQLLQCFQKASMKRDWIEKSD